MELGRGGLYVHLGPGFRFRVSVCSSPLPLFLSLDFVGFRGLRCPGVHGDGEVGRLLEFFCICVDGWFKVIYPQELCDVERSYTYANGATQ